MTALIVLGAIALLVLLVMSQTVKVIQQGYIGAVKRLGQYKALREPGLAMILPFVDNLTRVDIRETPRTGDRQEVITRDNVTVAVNATIFSQVVDPQAALFGVSDYHVAVDNLARASLRAVLGEMSLDEALSQREAINAKLQARMESETDKWGVRINRVEIIDIVPPAQILQAMALQKQADQEKRAAILQSEGQQQSQINIAEGQRQSQILQAEGQKQAQILYAEGQKQSQILEADGRAGAIGAIYGAINAGNPNPQLLAVLQLDTLQKFAESPNSKVLVPYESAGLLGAAQALRSVMDGVPEADKKSPV